MRGLLREPLVQFLLAGAVLFGAWRLVAPTPPGRQISVSALQLGRLRADHARRTGVAPTATEETALVGRYVDQEILYREALARGLDRGDVIVRRRLVQKMQFVAEEELGLVEPTEAALATWLAAHQERYSDGPLLSFEQIFVTTSHDIAAVEAALGHADPASLGDPFVGGRVFSARSERQISAQFGAEFARGLVAARVGRWTRLRSTFGNHLVRLSAFDPQLPALDRVRTRVRADVMADLDAHRAESALLALRARYAVSVVR